MKKADTKNNTKTTTKKRAPKKSIAKRPRARTEEDVHKYEATRPGAKRRPTRSPRPGRSDIDNLGELPRSHGETRLFAIAQEPYRLFCYWDYLLTESITESVCLRHRRGGASPEGEVAIPREANSWYLPVREANADYIIELGYYREGAWTLLAASRTVLTPRDTVDAPGTPVFANVPSHLSFQTLVEILRGKMRRGESLADTLARLQKSGKLPAELADSTHGSRLAPLLHAGLGSLSSSDLGRLFSPLGASLFLGASALGSWGSSSWGGKSAAESSGGFLEVMGLAAAPWNAASSSELGASWSSGSVSSWGGASGRGLSSWSHAPREFFMHVNAEVIFYGGTHPEAKVTIAGQPVTLRPDGSFRYHFVLPDGEFEIPVTATSPDGVETRRAVLKFERATTRHGEVGATAQPPLGAPMGRKK